MKMAQYRNNVVLVMTVLMMLIAGLMTMSAQDAKPQVDDKVLSNTYWLKMAEQGLVELNPEVEVAPAVYRAQTGKTISAVDNNPDVAVTSAGNTTQSEISVFVSPLDNNVILNSNNSTNNPVSILYGTSGFFSTNGGSSFGGSVNGTGGSNNGDPAAAINLSGTYFVNFINLSFGQGVAWSTNGGSSWSSATIKPSGTLDKNHMWVDNSTTSSFAGNLYAAWTTFSTNYGEIELYRSTNNGTSWTNSGVISAAVNAGSHNQGVHLQTGPNGEVYATWAIYDGWPTDETAIGFSRSLDGGASWSTATRIITNIKGIRTTENGKNQRVNSFPVSAVDISGGPNNGRIYVVWTNQGVPGINTGSDDDIYMIYSDNTGTSWSSPIRVNQDPSGQGNQHYFPWISCDPETGNLAVIFYDDRNVASNQAETFVATSTDGGQTWEDGVVSDVAFTPAPIPGLAFGYMGDYIAVSMRGDRVYPVWTDNRSGAALAYASPFDLATGGNQSPVAEANGPYAATTGDPINFSSAGSNDPDGSIVSYFWDFDDGNTSTAANPSHTYAGAGTYSVVLTVTDDMGAIDTDGATATVTDAGGIPCSDVTSFVARCNNAGTLQMRARFVAGHNGETATFTIDGSDVHVVNIANNRAQLALPNYGVGAHTVSLSDPAGCYADVNVTCTVLQADGNELQSLETIPESMVLNQNYPNPFNPTTSIRYGLSEDALVTLKIYNTLGQEIVSLVNSYQTAGYQTVEWDGRNALGQKVGSGIYIYRLKAGDSVVSKTMQLTQ